MNAEKIKIQRGGDDQRMNPFFAETALPEFHHFLHGFRGVFRRNGFEANTAAAIGVSLNDVHVLFLILAGIPNLSSTRFMKTFDGGLGNWKLRTAFMNEFQGVTVTADFLFLAVAQSRPAEYERANA